MINDRDLFGRVLLTSWKAFVGPYWYAVVPGSATLSGSPYILCGSLPDAVKDAQCVDAVMELPADDGDGTSKIFVAVWSMYESLVAKVGTPIPVEDVLAALRAAPGAGGLDLRGLKRKLNGHEVFFAERSVRPDLHRRPAPDRLHGPPRRVPPWAGARCPPSTRSWLTWRCVPGCWPPARSRSRWPTWTPASKKRSRRVAEAPYGRSSTARSDLLLARVCACGCVRVRVVCVYVCVCVWCVCVRVCVCLCACVVCAGGARARLPGGLWVSLV